MHSGTLGIGDKPEISKLKSHALHPKILQSRPDKLELKTKPNTQTKSYSPPAINTKPPKL